MRNLREELTACWCEAHADLPAAWRSALGDAEPNFGAVPESATLDSTACIVPLPGETAGPFYALEGIDPEDVTVVIVGNDPYPDPRRATGRAFEQGDITDWVEGLRQGRVTPSLLSLACAAAALHPGAEGLGLDGTKDRREKLQSALCCRLVALASPQSMFENLTGQGVLWINRTPTISAQETDGRWQAVEEHRDRRWHQALWHPITLAILRTLVGEARTRPIVFALFGDKAKKLKRQIERLGRAPGLPTPNLRFVKSGHPSLPHHYLRYGNPLGRINAELASQGRDAIDWCDPASIPMSGDTPGGGGTSRTRAMIEQSAGPSARSIAIMDRTVGKYRHTLRRLAER